MKKLGFGLMRLPMKSGAVNQEHVNEMADYFLGQGFNYFDTAYVYHNGESEVALKKALVERHPRDSFVIANKMPTFLVTQSSDYDKFWNEQIERCGVDFFDYYLLHNLGEMNYANSLRHGGFEYMKQLKSGGKARKIGFSFHDKAELLDEILAKHPEMEFVQLQINYVDWEDEGVQARRCYEVAEKHNKPVIVMTPIKGGLLADLSEDSKAVLHKIDAEASIASWALRFAASLPNVFMVLSGMSNIEQMRDNTGFMKDFVPLTLEEKVALDKVVAIMTGEGGIPCTACQYCVKDCPQDIRIPDVIALYNNQLRFSFTPAHWNYYMNLTQKSGKASDCISCGVCEKLCPQHISIIDGLQKVAGVFESE